MSIRCRVILLALLAAIAPCAVAARAADAPPAPASLNEAPANAAAAKGTADADTAAQPGPGQPPQDLGTQAVRLFGPTFEQTTLTGWLILLGAIFLGLVAGRIVQTTLLGVGGRMQQRKWVFRAAIFRHAAGPASLALLTLALWIALNSSVYLGDDARVFVDKLIGFLYSVAIAWFLFNSVELIDIGLHRVKGHRINEAVITLIRKALRIFILVMLGLFVAENVFGADITAWLAGLGIAGLAVSLAAQDPIKNLFGSITVLIERPFVVGDRIIFDGHDGTVEAIGFRSTRIRLLTGNLVTVPNMKFTDHNIENISARPSVRRIMNVTITYDTPSEKVEEAVRILRDILAEAEVAEGLNLPDQPPQVFFDNLNADSLNIFVIYWYNIRGAGRDWWSYQAFNEMVNLKLLTAFNEAGIEFAFPSRTLYLAGDARRELALRVLREPAVHQHAGNGEA